MKLYEIDEAILSCVDLKTGEIIDSEKLEELNIARDNKIENIALWVKNLKAEAAAYETEKKSFEQRQKAVENKIKGLTFYLNKALEGRVFKTEKVQISYRRSEIVELDEGLEINTLPDELYSEEHTYKPDKKAIKQYIKTHGGLNGCRLVTNSNIQIK